MRVKPELSLAGFTGQVTVTAAPLKKGSSTTTLHQPMKSCAVVS